MFNNGLAVVFFNVNQSNVSDHKLGKPPVRIQSGFLEKVVSEKSLEIENRRRQIPENQLQALANDRPTPGDFSRHLRSADSIAVIAELKKASPSAGTLREEYDIKKIARSYFDNGAAAFSVLTDEKQFQGNLEHLEAVSRLNLLPVLRKDFIIDSYQILEARAHGADAILLIVAALAKDKLAGLKSISDELGMASLIEVHSGQELEVALSIGAQLVGINNRNLKTLRTSLEITERLAPLVPRDCAIVSESGITSRADIERLAQCGIHAVLVGTHLMRHSDPGPALASLIGVPKR